MIPTGPYAYWNGRAHPIATPSHDLWRSTERTPEQEKKLAVWADGIRWLEVDETRRFDMNHWYQVMPRHRGGSCGFAACAAGWATEIFGDLDRVGLDTPNAGPIWFDKLMGYFGLTFGETDAIVSPYRYESNDPNQRGGESQISPVEVARRIDEVRLGLPLTGWVE